MNLYYLNPLNFIREVFFTTHTYFKEIQTRPDYSSQSLDGFRIFPEEKTPGNNREGDYSLVDSLINSKTSEKEHSKKISPEDLRPTEKGKRDIERKIKEVRREHTPEKDFQWDTPLR